MSQDVHLCPGVNLTLLGPIPFFSRERLFVILSMDFLLRNMGSAILFILVKLNCTHYVKYIISAV